MLDLVRHFVAGDLLGLTVKPLKLSTLDPDESHIKSATSWSVE